MSLASRIRALERKRSKPDDHIHWMIPNPAGGMISPSPKTCETCQATNFKSHYIILYNMRAAANKTLQPAI